VQEELVEDDGTRRERRDRKARRRRSFGVGILATFAVVLSVVTVTIFVISGTSIHNTTKAALEEALALRLETSARVVAREIEGDRSHPKLATTFVQNLRKAYPGTVALVSSKLKTMREASGARDVVVYDVVPQEKDPKALECKALVSARTGPSEDSAARSQTAADKTTMERVIANAAPASTPLIFWQASPEAEGRYYKSGFAPVIADGKVELLVGVDCPADFTASVDEVDRRFTLLGAGSIFVILVSAVFLVRQRVQVPIYRLVRAMEGGDDPEEPARPVHARVRWRDEIGALTDHYNRMVDRLGAQDAELRELYAAAQKKAVFLSGYSKYLVEGVPSAVVAVDPEGIVTVWNEGARAILAKGGAGAVGKPLREMLEPGHPVARALERALKGELSDEALVALGHPGDAEAGEADHEDAGARLVELAAGPFKNPETGAILGAAALVHDRTELERLRRAAARNERLAAVGRLAAGLAHEIRNPLGAISGFAELIERKRGGEDSARLATRLKGEVFELNRFLTEFLAFARDQRITRADEDLNELVRRAAETALQAVGFTVDETRKVLEGAPLARPEGGELRLAIEGDPALSVVAVDAPALKAAIVNIVKNALEAMKGKGALALRLRRSNDRAVLRVRDSGPGVPPELREKIFDPFFTTRDNGVGLGLAIAHKIVVAHGGKIAVRTPDEGGCEFVVRVPLTAAAAESAGPPAVEDDATPMEGAHMPRIEGPAPARSPGA
jgi:signal transduction histidine kinase